MRLTLVTLLMIGIGSEALAQGPYSAPPVQQIPPGVSVYLPGTINVPQADYTVSHRFGNVFVNTDGKYQSYLAIGSDVDQYARVTIKGAGAPFTFEVFLAAGSRGPQENGQPLYLNALAGLRGFSGGISVKVELEHPSEVSIAMHPEGPTFWTGVQFAPETFK